jgi:hypothetical protein
MLIERMRDVYREYINPVVTAEEITISKAGRPAANANRFEYTEMQARRHRRQRRIGRATGNNIHGWAVRSW